MVCLRGESLTTHMNQMKLFNAIAAAAVIGASFVAASPAIGASLEDKQRANQYMDLANDAIFRASQAQMRGDTRTVCRNYRKAEDHIQKAEWLFGVHSPEQAAKSRLIAGMLSDAQADHGC